MLMAPRNYCYCRLNWIGADLTRGRMFSATHQLRRQIPPTLLLGADRRAPTGTFRISQVDLIAQVASCEACSPDAAEFPFECILDRVMQFFPACADAISDCVDLQAAGNLCTGHTARPAFPGYLGNRLRVYLGNLLLPLQSHAN